MSRPRNCLFEQLKPFRMQFGIEIGRSSDISARPREAGNESRRDGIAGHRHHDRNRRGCLLGCAGTWSSAGHDNVNLRANELGRQARQPIAERGR